ncbi:acylneuraminate cytidylyltransferase family protein [Jatrophihabitans sp. YIM 134969]
MAEPAQVVAVVPARGGSVGFPGKNLRPFLGRPLVAHAVATAHAAGVRRVVCTTDSPEIAAAAAAEGAELVDRPAELATATAHMLDAVVHAADDLDLADTVVLALLPPTSPLRTPADVVEGIELLERRGAGSVVQVTPQRSRHPWKSVVENGGTLAPVRSWADLEAPRQSLPPAFTLTGGLYLARVGDLRDQLRFFVPAVVPQVVPQERSIDIDTAADLDAAADTARRLGLTPP